MFNARSFTQNGFIRRKDLDFGDDGAYFKGYEYNGMPITYLRCKEQISKFDKERQQYIYLDEYEYRCYISVRADYIVTDNREKLSFTTIDMLNTNWYKDCDKFNGVNEDEVDIDELKNIINNAWVGLHELNDRVVKEVVDYNKLKNRLSTEIYKGNILLEKFKVNFNCFDKGLSRWELQGYIGDFHALENNVKSSTEWLDTIYEKPLYALREAMQALDDYGYIVFNHKSYSIQEMIEYLANKNILDKSFEI